MSMRRHVGRPMRIRGPVQMGLLMLVAMGLGCGGNHRRMLYYNITLVH